MKRENPVDKDIDRQLQVFIDAVEDYAIFRLNNDGFVTSWNAGAQRAKGYTADEIIGRHYAVFFTFEDQSAGKPQEILSRATLEGRFADEGWRVRKDKSRFWASATLTAVHDENGESAGFIKITRDITEQHAAQEALHENEGWIRLLIDSLSDYAIFTLDREGFVKTWNMGAERTKGYKREEILGQPYAIFFKPEDQANGLPAEILRTAASQGHFEGEGWRVRKDGSEFCAHVVLDPMRDPAGNIVGFAKITRDITVKWVLRQAKEQLHSAQKIKALGHLTGGIAHNFNNLLSAVIGSLDLMEGMIDNKDVLRFVQIAYRAAERGGQLTHQLLAFSRKGMLQPQVSGVNELLLGFKQLLKHAAGEAIDLHFALGSDIWMCRIDPAHFQSALLNLIMNARDAMRSRGSITIMTENSLVDLARAQELNEIAPGPYVVVSVIDTGEGMTPFVKSHAIDPFFTTKDVGQGSGLGLSQVYGFLRQSKGQIEIISEPERGTTIRLVVPRAIEAKDIAAPETRPEAYKFQGTVLVVEDDPNVRKDAIEALTGFGFKVYPAQDGFEALKILQNKDPLDLLFTDIVMPNGMNGITLSLNALKMRPTLRVLLSSGYPSNALYSNKGLNANMAFIPKPYSLSSLRKKVAAVAPETVVSA